MGGSILENNCSSLQKQIFAGLRFHNAPKQALHIAWEDLSSKFTALLSGIMGREINAYAEREEIYYWSVTMFDTPITPKEFVNILILVDINVVDPHRNDYRMYPIRKLCLGLCVKLMSKLLPFNVDCTFADNEGVWFISDTAITTVWQAIPDGKLLVAEALGEPEYPAIRISLRSPSQDDEVICFAEHNSAKPAGKELCIAAYSFNQDEPAYYESYNDPSSVSPNN